MDAVVILVISCLLVYGVLLIGIVLYYLIERFRKWLGECPYCNGTDENCISCGYNSCEKNTENDTK